MALVRMRTLMAIVASVSAHLVFASTAFADDCSRFAQHRDSYLYNTSAGMEQALAQMAQQRGVPVQAAAFYWGGDLMRANDPTSLRSLSLLTLASYGWRDNTDRAETAMERIFNERGHAFAGLLVGLMLSDDQGAADFYQARAYLADASRAGSSDAESFLALFDRCHRRAMAFN